MKDETRGSAIDELVALKPKMYSFFVDNSEHKKSKMPEQERGCNMKS